MLNSRTLLNRQTSLLSVFQYIVFGGVILYFGRTVFVPISFAVLISFVLYPICAWLETKGLTRLSAIIISLLFLVLLGLLVVGLLIYQFVEFLGEWSTIQSKLVDAITILSKSVEVFGIGQEQQHRLVTKIVDQSGSDLLGFIRGTISASTFSFVLMIIIPVYAVFILYYRRQWMKILVRLFSGEKEEVLHSIILETIQTYYAFIKGMAIVYIVVGSLNSVGLLLLGVPHAILFGFIASILTFIPYVGIIVGSLLPMAMAWITYDSMWYPIGVVGIFALVQYLEANVIFPIAVSDRLNVNTLVMLVAIFIGGVVWGMAGMILFVPFVGIVKLIADRNPKWKTLSLILGRSNGPT
ncbi:AI-2E family transporter [Pseudochryseolinea flava]|uniref:AI-2E family transporter n=2 Tax=Pseudochryseolinea flava TaxID=2059302 RepID=A0A364XV77_9BACT|nr:AI-2E family transporter [Pseudochryseolinea flava]